VRSSVVLRFALLLALASAAVGQSSLADATLEQLLQTQVTSVSKKEQRLGKAAAAVFVIHREDIVRSGASNLADVLRLAPGVDVAAIDNNSWAISIRGFNSRYSNKVLVLIDGRSVYTPDFSGVFWEHLEPPLEDIERIEVVRGPGGTLWGANAVNGVINITTRSARATTGGMLVARSGSDLYGDGMLRYGSTAGGRGAWRAFGRYFKTGSAGLPDGSDGADGWRRVHAGFRSDWDLSGRDSLTVQGDVFSNRQGQTVRSSLIPSPLDRVYAEQFESSGGDLLARWSHRFEHGAEMVLQGYYDTFRRTDLESPESLRAFDLDLQYRFAAGRHDIVWGLGYRRTNSGVEAGALVSLTPPFRSDGLYSGFLQDEIRIAPSVWATVGTKLEHNGYTGFEYEPGVRLAWAATPRTTLWAAAARAIRQPARLEMGVGVDLAAVPLDGNTVQTLRLTGNPDVKTEELRDYELGYRTDLSGGASLDVAAFVSQYRRLMTIEPGQPRVAIVPPLVRITIPLQYDNRASALTYGGEVALNWSAVPHWRLTSSGSYLHLNPRFDASSRDTMARADWMNVPAWMFQVRSQWDVTRKLKFDQWLSWTGRLPGGDTPSYTRLDSRLARSIGEFAEISIVGQNLLRPGTLEFPNAIRVIGTMAPRSVYGRIAWRF
jgi:iron complex outermembrane receptor protein